MSSAATGVVLTVFRLPAFGIRSFGFKASSHASRSSFVLHEIVHCGRFTSSALERVKLKMCGLSSGTEVSVVNVVTSNRWNGASYEHKMNELSFLCRNYTVSRKNGSQGRKTQQMHAVGNPTYGRRSLKPAKSARKSQFSWYPLMLLQEKRSQSRARPDLTKTSKRTRQKNLGIHVRWRYWKIAK